LIHRGILYLLGAVEKSEKIGDNILTILVIGLNNLAKDCLGMLKKGDIILVAVLLVVAVSTVAGMFIFRGNSSNTDKIAVIKQGDRIVKEIKLNEIGKSEKITIEGNYKNVILFENGKIRFEESTCPDKVCVKTGWLTDEGDMAVCLPNQVIVKIEGINTDIDGVTH